MWPAQSSKWSQPTMKTARERPKTIVYCEWQGYVNQETFLLLESDEGLIYWVEGQVLTFKAMKGVNKHTNVYLGDIIVRELDTDVIAAYSKEDFDLKYEILDELG